MVLPHSISEQLVEHIAKLNEPEPEARIFPSPEGGPFRRTAWMRRVWKPALTGANLNHNRGTPTLRRSQVAAGIQIPFPQRTVWVNQGDPTPVAAAVGTAGTHAHEAFLPDEPALEEAG